MKNMRKWMLGAAVVAGAMGLGTTAAQAAEFGVYVRGPVAYVPPSPGPGYEWVAGYQTNGYWVPGRWNFIGGRDNYREARVYGDRDRYVARDFRSERMHDRDWDRNRGNDRDRGGDHGYRDHDRR